MAKQRGGLRMSTVTVAPISEAEARARRADIIALVGGDEQAFFQRAHDYLLDARELALYDELSGLDYLLAP